MAKGLERCFEFQKARLCLRPKMPIRILKSSRDTSLEGMSDLLVIETNLTISSTTSWIIDFDSSIHLGTSIQGFKECRRLKLGEMILWVGNGARITAIAVGTYLLRLPSGFFLKLRDCYCIPNASKNLISIWCLA